MIINFKYNINFITVMFADDTERICVSFGGDSYLSYSDLLARLSRKCNDWQVDELYFEGVDEIFDKDAKSMIFLISTLEYLGKHIHIFTSKDFNTILSLWPDLENDPDEMEITVDHWGSATPEIKTCKSIYARPSAIICKHAGEEYYSKRYIKEENNKYIEEDEKYLNSGIFPLLKS